MSEGFVVAIDGPAASGKSTTARLVAERLGFLYIDTGAMYRAMTLRALEERIDLDDSAALKELAARTRVEMVAALAGVRILVDDRDVTDELRAPRISRAVSRVARVAAVREALVAIQREIGKTGRVVLEGRDIGTVVFPNADVKIYLEASLAERARRRQRELASSGTRQDLAELEAEIELRDRLDSEREASPLRRAEDAVGLDTTGLTVEDQVARVLEIVRDRLESS